MDRLVALHTILAIHRFTPTLMLDVPRGLEHLQKAEAALAEGPSERARAKLDLAITVAAGRALRISEGLAASSRGKEIADRLDDRRLSAQLGSQRALLLFYAGRWAEGFGLLDEACRTADALNDQVLLYGANTVLTGMIGWLQDPRTMATLAQRKLAEPAPRTPLFTKHIITEISMPPLHDGSTRRGEALPMGGHRSNGCTVRGSMGGRRATVGSSY